MTLKSLETVSEDVAVLYQTLDPTATGALPSASRTAVVGTTTVYFRLPENFMHDQYT